MPAVRGQFAPLLVPGARKVFIDEYDEISTDYQQVIKTENSTKAFEDDLVMAGLPIAVFKPEGEAIAFDRPVFRGKVRYLHAGYGLGYEITREAVEDDQYAAINSQGATNLARSMREAERVSAWGILNEGFTTITTYDGVSLFNTAHPGVGSFVQRNMPDPDVDLSTGALKGAMEDYFNLVNDRQLRINIRPEKLVVPVDNWWIANEILGTQTVMGGPSTNTDAEPTVLTPVSERVINVVTMMGLTPLMSPYITDPDSWFLSPSMRNNSAQFMWRRTPDMVSGDDERAGLAWVGITARWSTGATDWHGWYGSQGA